MDYQKDNKKTDLNNQGNGNSSFGLYDNKSLSNKPLYEYVNKKTEKLVTALYMVTDCMPTDDALKSKIRLLGVELLSDTYKLPNLSPVEKKNNVANTLSHISEVLSLIEISCTIGFISDMNTSILKRELISLISQLEINQSKDNHFSFDLDRNMFNVSGPQIAKDFNSSGAIKDKRTLLSMSFKNNSTGANMSSIRSYKQTVSENVFNKEDRINKILNLIKDKKEVSIKDISTAFTDCSEKTIQRELNSLISKGQIKKIGSKRWSRYQAI